MSRSTTLSFTLRIGSLPPEKFRVMEFTLTEAISECFHLQVEATSGDGILAYEDLIGKDATLTVTGKDFPISHHGMVTAFNQYPDDSESFGGESYLYEIVIEPHLRKLAYTTQNRIFQKQKLKDIVEEVFKAASLAANHYEYQVKGTPREREYTVQYNETDLDFITRLLEDEGVRFHFDHSGDWDKVIFSDTVDAVKSIPKTPSVNLIGNSGLSHLSKEGDSPDHVSKISRAQRMVTGTVTVKDYNDRTPGVNVIGKAAKPGQGQDYQYGPQALNMAEAMSIANLRAEMHATARVQLHGESICRAFRAGMRFELKDDGRSQFAGKYTLVRVTHHGDQREGFEGDEEKIIYSNNFQCIPADTVFRPNLHTPKPRIHGVLSARVDGVDGKYAYLDDDGRYHAKLPFDLTDRKDGQASLPVRMNQPYGGPNYGMHFPVHNGNEIVLGFEQGDPDRPIALGTVPNPMNGSPVNKRNASESIIRTASGHQIKLDDKEGKTVIEILTKGKQVITLNDDPDHQEIRIHTTNGNEIVLDDTQKNIRMCTPKGAHTLKMDYDKKVFSVETKYGHKLTMDDEAKRATLQTKDGHILDLNDDKKSISIQDGKAKHVFQIDAGGSKISVTTEGDMEFKAKGKLDVEAKEINMTAKTGKINLKASVGDILVDGMNVEVKGKQKVALEGTVEASLKGAQTKIEGTATLEMTSKGQTKVGGTMVSVEGQAMAEVKGAMVMIN